MKIFFLLFIITAVQTFALFAQDKLLEVSAGKIERIKNFHSRYISSRNIDIWLPDGYSDSTKYAVL